MTKPAVIIREVGLRDGLQLVPGFLATELKTEWIAGAVAAGVAEIEVTSFVPPRVIPQFADADAVVGFALPVPGLTASVLVPNLKGAERAVAAGARELNFVLSVSESHNRANVNRSTAESIEDFGRIIALRDALEPSRRPRVFAGLATAFGCSIEGQVSEARVLAIAERLLAMGADGLLVADTVGYGNPVASRRLSKGILALAGDRPVTAHFHDTRGLGLANALAAYEAGIRRFDASLGGLGGCPFAPGATGNIVLEDAAFMFEAMGLSTGIDLGALIVLRKKVESWLNGSEFHGNLAKAGLPRR